MERKVFVPECARNLKSPGLPGSTVVYSVCSELTNSLFLEDCCSLSDQNSFILTSSRIAFILALRDRDRANKNEIGIFVSSVTSNDFPHAMLLTSPIIHMAADHSTTLRQCEEYDECQDDCKNWLHLIGIGQVLPNFVKPFLDATAVTCRTHDRLLSFESF
jgi:hypothetical protein